MNDLVKTSVPGLLKDKKNGMIINKNEAEYQRVLAGRQKNKELQFMRREIDTLKIQVQMLMDKLGLNNV